jgi:hypothetical protein
VKKNHPSPGARPNPGQQETPGFWVEIITEMMINIYTLIYPINPK